MLVSLCSPSCNHDSPTFCVLQVEGCSEAGAALAEQSHRLSVPPLSLAGPDAQAERQSQPGNSLPGWWWQEVRHNIDDMTICYDH